MSTYNFVRIQAKDVFKDVAVIDAGGVCYVCKGGTPEKAVLLDVYGNSLANPIALNYGLINFQYDTSISALVDLYVQTAGGHFVVYKSVSPSGPNELFIDSSRKRGLMKIPFSINDYVANTETKTGFKLPASSMILDRLHGAGVLIVTVEASKTISFGLLSTESGGAATGFINGASTTTAGQVIGTNGSLFSSNAPCTSDAQTAADISLTISSGAVAAEGFGLLPYVLNA